MYASYNNNIARVCVCVCVCVSVGRSRIQIITNLTTRSDDRREVSASLGRRVGERVGRGRSGGQERIRRVVGGRRGLRVHAAAVAVARVQARVHEPLDRPSFHRAVRREPLFLLGAHLSFAVIVIVIVIRIVSTLRVSAFARFQHAPFHSAGPSHFHQTY